MRVTNHSVYLRFLAGLAAARERSAGALESLGDGKRVRVASDDPGVAREALALRARFARLVGLDRSAEAASADLSTIDSVLGDLYGYLTEARDTAMAGVSEPAESANDIRATKIEGLREQILALANTQQRGRYLFAGTETLTSPFDSSGAYFGNDAEVQAPIESDRQIGATLSGERVFNEGGEVLTMLDDLALALRDNRTDDISAMIPSLTAAMDHIAEVRAEAGDRLNQIDRSRQRHGDERLILTQRISELEDADLAQVIVDLSNSETSANALSSAANSILGRSLFDYLG